MTFRSTDRPAGARSTRSAAVAVPASPDVQTPSRSAPVLSTIADAPINILIVDDEPKNLVVLETVLDSPGYRLVRASSADDALLALVADEFALLILDVRMPGMTGFELAQTIKGRKKTSRVPIIFLTAYYSEDQHVLEGYGSGAVDYLHKPINAAVLRSKVAVFAELHRKNREIEISNRALIGEVTERRRAEERLQEVNDNLDRLVTERTRSLQQLEMELRETDRRKDDFIATLAHELRNPLAPVRNAVHILQLTGVDSPGSKRAREIIARQVAIMARLIDDLLDVSRINQGRIELQREQVDLATVLDLAIEASSPHIEECGHTLSVARADEPVALYGDVTRLSQVFVNLLTNAAKYTDRGGHIELAVQLDGHHVEVSVKDDGIGIHADQLGSVFTMFSQVEGAMSRSRGGLGIGLSLVKSLVELHGGNVAAFSPGLGAGSSFVVTLPLAGQAASGRTNDPPATACSESAQAAASFRLLVVDDNREGAESMATLLTLLGHDVRTAHDGQAALHAADEFRPHAIFLDIGLPLLDGYEVCRRIKQQPWGKQVSVVAVTGWGDQNAKSKGESVGFDGHLVKPLDESLLTATLARLERP